MGNMFEPEVEYDGQSDGTWRTPNLALVAWLLYQEHVIRAIELNEFRQALWAFEETDELQEDVMDFNSGSVRVEPTRFYQSIQQARKELHRRHPNRKNVA